MEKITSYELCTGCKVCADICPVGAISFPINNEGFWYPEIDSLKCISCGMCQKICPSNGSHARNRQAPKIYSAWNKNNKIRMCSTSGGLFYAFAKQIISQGGSVVGCRYRKNFKGAYHVIINDIKNLDDLVGSKYFQSDTSDIYSKTKELLEQNRIILFCGTPCQVDALYHFLGTSYSNLLTMDFICLGINSPKAFEMFVLEQEMKKKAKVKFVQLKNKKHGWKSLGSYMEFTNGKVFLATKENDLWIKGFIKDNLFMRTSCYQCQYRKIPHSADITVGDFWGITNISNSNLFKGVSAVMINSEQGKKLFEMASIDLTYREQTINELQKGNPALKENPKITPNRKTFFHLLDTMPFSKAVKKSCSTKKGGSMLDGFSMFDILFRIKKERPLNYLKKKKILDKVNVSSFIYYNYYCANVKRDTGIYFIPYKNSVIELADTARIYIHNKDIELGIGQSKKTKTETILRMGKDAKWFSGKGAKLFYNTTLEICENAKFENGYFTTNFGCVIICVNHISLGEDVMLGRNVTIYDSDHHQILDENNNITNYGRDVTIGNHVWIASFVTVLKGVRIGDGSVIGAKTLVTKNVPPHSIVTGCDTQKVISYNINWSRKAVR